MDISTSSSSTATEIWQLLQEVNDPEVPVLSVIDLGIIRDVQVNDGVVEVFITPTYTGCPAMDAISVDIRLKLIEHGYKKVKISTVLSPAWTTDWMTEAGKEKLNIYGIAPPNKLMNAPLHCPQCNSTNISIISHFGSTACKALYKCEDCKEPFDYFKCH